jgi:hypothetical protein
VNVEVAGVGRGSLRVLGLMIAGAGGLAGLAMLALPWARYTVSAQGEVSLHQTPSAAVFSLHLGTEYLGLVILTVALLAGALAGQPSWRVAYGGLAMLAAVGAVAFAITIGNEATSTAGRTVAAGLAEVSVQGQAAIGVWFGVFCPALLGLGAAIAGSAGRAPVPSLTAAESSVS